jgi:hypothetical protein
MDVIDFFSPGITPGRYLYFMFVLRVTHPGCKFYDIRIKLLCLTTVKPNKDYQNY